MPFKSYSLDTEGTQGGWVPPAPLDYRQHIIRAIFIESSYAILYWECKATISYLLMYFGPQFTEATDIITLESVIFPMRFCAYITKFIDSSSNNITYSLIHHFTQKTMLNQTLYYTIR